MQSDVHTWGRLYADAIITRRIEKCMDEGLRSGNKHRVYVDPDIVCPWCGINRRYRYSPIYLESRFPGAFGETHTFYQITGMKVTLL